MPAQKGYLQTKDMHLQTKDICIQPKDVNLQSGDKDSSALLRLFSRTKMIFRTHKSIKMTAQTHPSERSEKQQKHTGSPKDAFGAVSGTSTSIKPPGYSSPSTSSSSLFRYPELVRTATSCRFSSMMRTSMKGTRAWLNTSFASA